VFTLKIVPQPELPPSLVVPYSALLDRTSEASGFAPSECVCDPELEKLVFIPRKLCRVVRVCAFVDSARIKPNIAVSSIAALGFMNLGSFPNRASFPTFCNENFGKSFRSKVKDPTKASLCCDGLTAFAEKRGWLPPP
jgi:hypothetical protein